MNDWFELDQMESLQKMDIVAIMNADDDMLRSLGLVTGDIINLKAFCKKYNKPEVGKQEKRRKLLESYFNSKSTKPSKSFSSLKKPEKKKTKKVMMGWKHYQNNVHSYVLVPLSKGGGSRKVDVPLSANKLDLIKIGKSLFFENGESIFGKESNMSFSLGNFKNQVIQVTINVGEKELPFNVSNYIDAHKMKDVRIYLLSKKIDESSSEEESGDEGSEGSLRQMLHFPCSDRPSSPHWWEDLIDERDPFVDSGTDQLAGLIGASAQRETLCTEQLKEYNDSLKADRLKEQAKELKRLKLKQKEKVHAARTARLLIEPDENFCTVKVRHLSRGICSRRFPVQAQMAAVYDWVGSLDMYYDTFSLCKHSGAILMPDDEICDQCTLTMTETDENPAMSMSDPEISFLGYGPASTSDTTLTDADCSEVLNTLPVTNEPQELDKYYAAICMPGPSGMNSDSEGEPEPSPEPETIIGLSYVENTKRDASDILDELAEKINPNNLTKLNIARKYLWEGAKRAVGRKSFNPTYKLSVKFTDDFGASEGAVDWGGPMREFLSLIMKYLEDSHLFCGRENRKFISFNSTAVQEGDYRLAGTLIAMSLVHGGPSPDFFAPPMFDAIASTNPELVDVSIEDIYDCEIQEALIRLSVSKDLKEAIPLLQERILMTLVDLSGTYIRVKSLDDIREVIRTVCRWYIFGRAVPALDSFKQGLSTLGVLEAIQASPDTFRSVFCPSLEERKLTAEMLDKLFDVTTSDVGSTKAVTESLVLSRWRDFLQDLEEDDGKISLSDVLFFATGCHSLPPRRNTLSPKLEFLHTEGKWGLPKYPTANVCSPILRLPVGHSSYESFTEDMVFGIQNGRGFGQP